MSYRARGPREEIWQLTDTGSMGQSGSGLFQETIRLFHKELISPRHPVSALVSCLPELQPSAFGMSGTSVMTLHFALWQSTG